MARGNWALTDLPPYLATLILDIGSQGDLKSVGSDTMTITDGSYASPTVKRAGTASNNNTKTNEERFQLRLPSRRTTHGSADSGLEAIQGDIVIEVTARRTGTPATSMQLSMTAKENDKQGGVGAELVTTAAQDMLGVAINTWFTYQFTIDGTGLDADSLVNCCVRCVNNDTGGGGGGSFEIGDVRATLYQHG